jgi:hypothetical protein
LSPGDTVYYKIIGNEAKAKQAECPPKDNNFILVTK